MVDDNITEHQPKCLAHNECIVDHFPTTVGVEFKVDYSIGLDGMFIADKDYDTRSFEFLGQGLVSLFNGISTFVGYSMPNTSL